MANDPACKKSRRVAVSQKETGVGPPSALWIDWVEWEGPLVKQAPVAKTMHIEPETRRAEVERDPGQEQDHRREPAR